MLVGFTCGSFDLCHYGHVLMLKWCRENCDYLIVGVQEDPTIDRPHKNKPIQSLEERIGQIAAIRYVDGVITYSTEEDLYTYLSSCPPDVRFIGADWKGKPYTGHDLGIKVIFNPRDHTYSSSELRMRILEAGK